MKFVQLALLLTLGGLPSYGSGGYGSGGYHSAQFGAGLENSQWYLTSSIFACSLTHEIPNFGRGVFVREAGEAVRFYLDAPYVRLRAGQAALVIEAPAWRPGAPVENLGYVASREESRPVAVETRRASVMMNTLLRGMAPTFTRQARYGDETVKVRLSPINFVRAYNDYLDCVAGLLPVNFQQVERSALLFEAGDTYLTDAARARLEQVILYVKADSSINSLVIDGHSDSFGHRLTNRELSKERAERVAQYLRDAGFSDDMITVRYHGERYPVLDNKSEANRARNRRATLRLERRSPSQMAAMEQERSAS